MPAKFIPRATGAAFVALALGLGGCSGFGSFGGEQPTASIVPPAPKIDPACVTIRAQIDGLNKEGVAAKLDKAAQKKAKMTPAELAKVSQLIKVKDEYTAKCPQQAAALASEVPPAPVAASAPPAVSQIVAKAKPQ